MFCKDYYQSLEGYLKEFCSSIILLPAYLRS